MATHARVLIYQGEQTWLDEQLGQALPQGRNIIGGPDSTTTITTTITVIDLPDSLLLHVVKEIVKDEG